MRLRSAPACRASATCRDAHAVRMREERGAGLQRWQAGSAWKSDVWFPKSVYRAKSHSQDDISTIEQRQNTEPEGDETESPQQRRKLFGEPWLEEERERRLMQGGLLAGPHDLDQRVGGACHQSRSDECHQRVGSVDHERRRPLAHAEVVDQPHAGGEE